MNPIFFENAFLFVVAIGLFTFLNPVQRATQYYFYLYSKNIPEFAGLTHKEKIAVHQACAGIHPLTGIKALKTAAAILLSGLPFIVVVVWGMDKIHFDSSTSGFVICILGSIIGALISFFVLLPQEQARLRPYYAEYIKNMNNARGHPASI